MPTTFYPLYEEGNDQVDRVSAIRQIGFQEVRGRYRLSTSETRDLGTGPDVESILYVDYGSDEARRVSPRIADQKPVYREMGRFLDLFA